MGKIMIFFFSKNIYGPSEFRPSHATEIGTTYPRVAFHHTNIDRKKNQKQTDTHTRKTKRLQSKIIIKR